jgi:hypothetical protein
MMSEKGKMMNAPDAPQHLPRISAIHRLESAEAKTILDLVSSSAKLLFENGQRPAAAKESHVGRVSPRRPMQLAW